MVFGFSAVTTVVLHLQFRYEPYILHFTCWWGHYQILIIIRSDRRSEPINFYTPCRSLIWRYQFLSEIVTLPIWMCHCACGNRFAKGH